MLADYLARPLGDAPEASRVERFQREVTLVGGTVAVVATLAEAHGLLRSQLAHWGASRVVSWAPSEFPGWELDRTLDEVGAVWFPAAAESDRSAFRRAALQADVGITAATSAIVNTGTLVLAAGPGRPRSVSLLPTVHLVLVRESQLVDRLGLALVGLRAADGLASAIHFITGPSRTSDIENDLSIGVHGPAAVAVILWRDGIGR